MMAFCAEYGLRMLKNKRICLSNFLETSPHKRALTQKPFSYIGDILSHVVESINPTAYCAAFEHGLLCNQSA
ncbi:MAG: hypothetical protein LBE09_00680 [Christensenellaceae bacterium]|nr:hypothetical protein [Christensenellaceae bacterium]